MDSTLAHPQQPFNYGDAPLDLANLAASLAFGLAQNHHFIDGKKRTAHVFYRVFLHLNHGNLIASDEEKYVAMIDLADDSLSEKDFADWLRARIEIDPLGDVQESEGIYI